MNIIKLERIADLFDEDIVEEMLEIVDEPAACHYNAAQCVRQFSDWDCIEYVEGYSFKDGIGHAINSYEDYNGNIHYFDITQEKALIAFGQKEFDNGFIYKNTIPFKYVNEHFSELGHTELIEVELHLDEVSLFDIKMEKWGEMLFWSSYAPYMNGSHYENIAIALDSLGITNWSYDTCKKLESNIEMITKKTPCKDINGWKKRIEKAMK